MAIRQSFSEGVQICVEADRPWKLGGGYRAVALLDVIAAQQHPLTHSDLRQSTKCVRLQVDVVGRQNHQGCLSAIPLEHLFQQFRHEVEVNDSTRIGFQQVVAAGPVVAPAVITRTRNDVPARELPRNLNGSPTGFCSRAEQGKPCFVHSDVVDNPVCELLMQVAPAGSRCQPAV
ncbi:hypothetical protein D3C84_704800 [compost metagenome]